MGQNRAVCIAKRKRRREGSNENSGAEENRSSIGGVDRWSLLPLLSGRRQLSEPASRSARMERAMKSRSGAGRCGLPAGRIAKRIRECKCDLQVQRSPQQSRPSRAAARGKLPSAPRPQLAAAAADSDQPRRERENRPCERTPSASSVCASLRSWHAIRSSSTPRRLRGLGAWGLWRFERLRSSLCTHSLSLRSQLCARRLH